VSKVESVRTLIRLLPQGNRNNGSYYVRSVGGYNISIIIYSAFSAYVIEKRIVVIHCLEHTLKRSTSFMSLSLFWLSPRKNLILASCGML
jgi:hypothetical protein